MIHTLLVRIKGVKVNLHLEELSVKFYLSIKTISIFVTVNYEGVMCYNTGSPLPKPRPFSPSPWASDGEEPTPHSSIRSDVSFITEIEMHTFAQFTSSFFLIAAPNIPDIRLTQV
jgi:hypothetical protein